MAAAIPSRAALLDLWESGLDARPATRSLALLQAADPGASPDELTELEIGAAGTSLIRLRRRLFGDVVEGVSACRECGDRVEVGFDLSTLVGGLVANGDRPSIQARLGGQMLTVRRPRIRDVLAAEEVEGVDAAYRVLLEHALEETAVTPDVLSAEESSSLGEQLAARDPAADLRLSLECTACGTAWLEDFEPASFLWDELDAWARRLVGDVHEFACAYGWTEEEVLALSERRRELYLELVTG